MSILHTFTGGIDGAVSTSDLVFDTKGNLYGTTQFGGLWGSGTVFSLSPLKNGTWGEAEYSFTGAPNDGASPYAGVTFGNGGVFGTTASGGADNLGTVYEITAK
jgi:uncharacterized repeat protein (TIGR03803 family)